MAFMELLKFPARSAFPATGDNNRLYIDLHSKRIYYWERGAYQIASPDIVEQGSNPISEAFSYAGIVETVADLPTEGVRIGDVYIVEQDEGHEQNSAYVWSGSQWIEIGGDMEHIVAISWESLKALRDAGELIPDQQYRITDYVTTTAQANTQSAGHPFDIIVTADSTNKLNENARACLHAGDTYFANNSKLEAWQVWYSLDNDTNRFAWADDVNGKGVIYRLIDEWNNDCPYDFKNIQFLRDDDYYYTFTGYDDADTEDIVDISTIQNRFGNDEGGYSAVFNNKINEWLDGPEIEGGWSYMSTKLNDIVFISKTSVDLFYGLQGNTFGTNCRYNTFGNDCISNTFGHNCYYNTFGNSCFNNAFGNSCSSNTFGDDCYFNTFGYNCYGNTFGHNCNSNTFGNSFVSNSFGSDVNSNSFGNDVYSNSFGNFFWYNTIKNAVWYVMTPDATYPNKFQYITLENGLSGASSANRLNLDGIKMIVGNGTPIKVARGVETEIVAVWQSGIALAGLRKATPTTADWS